MRNVLDYPLILTILAIGSVSLLIIFSLNKNLAANQIYFWIIGLVVMAVISYFNLRYWQFVALPFYFLTLVFLISLFFVAEPVRGSTRWIDLGFFRFQPSEIAKVSSVLILALFFLKKSATEVKNLILSFLLILPPFILTFIQPDIGNSIPFLIIWLGISTVSGLKLKTVFITFILAILFSFLSFNFLAPYQKGRLYTFINPGSDPLGTGYSLIQSKIAIGSGQLLGRGLGKGPQSQLEFLPEVESDFIFASVTEQLGFLGAGLVIVLFSLLLLRIITFAKDANHFGKLVIAGSVSYLLFQFVINIGMNLGLVPVTGITLPFVSYGGSSLISTLFLIGVVMSTKRSIRY